MNQEYKELELLPKIVTEVKKLTGIEVKPNYRWMENMIGGLVDHISSLLISKSPREDREAFVEAISTSAEKVKLLTLQCSSLKYKELELLQKIVTEVKKLTGIEVRPDYRWMENMTLSLIDYTSSLISQSPREDREALGEAISTSAENVKLLTLQCSSLITRNLDKHSQLYCTLLKLFLDRILFIKKIKDKNSLEYMVTTTNKILFEIQALSTILVSTTLDDADNAQST